MGPEKRLKENYPFPRSPVVPLGLPPIRGTGSLPPGVVILAHADPGRHPILGTVGFEAVAAVVRVKLAVTARTARASRHETLVAPAFAKLLVYYQNA